MDADKIRENRLRRAAERQGLKLIKSKRRDKRALDYGHWMVVNAATNNVEYGGHGHVGLEEVEKFLNGEVRHD